MSQQHEGPLMLTTVTNSVIRANLIDGNQRRIVGLILAELGRQRLAGRVDIADVLDELVDQIEYPDKGLTSAS